MASDATQILQAITAGRSDVGKLMELVYDDLRGLARAKLSGATPNHSLDAGSYILIDPNDPLTKAWVETWAKAARKLDAIHRQEFRDFVYDEHIQEIDELLDIACRFAQPRKTSGLVEQQRLFQKWRNERDL